MKWLINAASIVKKIKEYERPFNVLFVIMALSLFVSNTLNVQADDNEPSVVQKSLLPELVQIARDEGDKVFTICEICNGISQVEIIREGSRCHNTYSVAKLFVVATLGTLSDQGIVDIDEKVYPIFEKVFPVEFDSKWREVKISDVIRQRIGLGPGCNFLDIDGADSSLWERDYLRIVLSQSLMYQPGEKFFYTDAAFYLASRIVDAKSGESLDAVMRRNLLEPMRFKEYAFSTDPEGFPIGATGMYISTEDMAKLGQLFVQNGIYEGKRLLSEKFIDDAFKRTFELYPLDKEGAAYEKGGIYGQWLYMNRKTRRVVAIHSFGSDIDRFQRFLLEHDH